MADEITGIVKAFNTGAEWHLELALPREVVREVLAKVDGGGRFRIAAVADRYLTIAATDVPGPSMSAGDCQIEPTRIMGFLCMTGVATIALPQEVGELASMLVAIDRACAALGQKVKWATCGKAITLMLERKVV